MNRWTALVVGALVVALAGVWLALAVPGRRTAAPPASPRAGAQVAAASLDDLLMDLQLIPIDAQTPRAFALESLDGRRVALADLAGRPALLYFWASW
jgi:cytochrome oxidase Cu insertion factor (SCO1/SenC/PrrC family)